jgi:hypothetical protein
MLNKCILSLFFVCGLLTSVLMADGSDPLFEPEKKYDISICAIIKNEAFYLRDWIEYHLSVGVDHFYLYNVGSKDSYEKVLHPYIRKNVVTFVDWPEALSYHEDHASMWALSTQIPAYENAVNFLARDETKWLVFMDIDEFLVLSKESVKDLLKKYSEFPGISFSSEFFDGAIYDTLNKKTLRAETFEISDLPQEIAAKSMAKMIFKPDQCKGFTWPPYQCCFKEFVSCMEMDRGELVIKRVINQNMIYRFFGVNRALRDEVIYPIPFEGVNENRFLPFYQRTPEFLIKLRQ